jgi:hypothetical protein
MKRIDDLSPKKLKELKKLILDGEETYVDIAYKFGFHKSTIGAFAKRIGAPKRTISKLTPEQRKELKARILKGEETYESLRKEYGLSSINQYVQELGLSGKRKREKWTCVRIDQYLKDNGFTARRIPCYSRNIKDETSWWQCGVCNHKFQKCFDALMRAKNKVGCQKCGYSKHTVNPNCFDARNEYTAFALGMIFARSSIYIRKNQPHVIDVRSTSEDALKKFNDIVGSDFPIKQSDNFRIETYRLVIKNNEFVENIKKIIGNKKLIPKCIKKKYIQFFIRGYMVGRGQTEEDCNASQEHGMDSCRITISGQKKILKKIKKSFNKQLENDLGYIKAPRRKGHDSVELIFVGKNSPYTFVKWLYFFDDKREKASKRLIYADEKFYEFHDYLEGSVHVKNEHRAMLLHYKSQYSIFSRKINALRNYKIQEHLGINNRTMQKILAREEDPDINAELRDAVFAMVKRRDELKNRQERTKELLYIKTGVKSIRMPIGDS